MSTSVQTPRQRGLPTPRPSYGASPNNFSASTSAASTNRNASLRALNGHTGDPKTPAGRSDGGDLDIGDAVNVPGEMYGIVKFVGSVKGKNGTFVGVELDSAFASKGKNGGDVDGTQYFTTTVPGSGIFLPVHRAQKRTSPSLSVDGFPGTPDTPTYSTVNGKPATKTLNGTTPSLPSKFSQTVGPGARPPSPNFKPKRPSLPRPESPFRKPAPHLAPTPARNQLSQSQIGGTSRTPAKSTANFRASTTTRPSMGHTTRPYSRSSSRMGNNGIDEERAVGTAVSTNGRTASNGSAPLFSQTHRSPSRLGSAGGQDHEIQRLKKELAERDRRLDEQAASLAEMEQSVKELSNILPSDAMPLNGEEQSVNQLRQMLREKNEKISILTAEFDAHRADFRSTLDSLEMASTETERVYEEQKRDLLAQLADLQDVQQSKEDFDGVAAQLKQLEDLVAELEEGLEESRRGEAEARGEVEFLRGEVERTRSELKREREKAAASATAEGGGSGSDKNTPLAKEMEKKDDEIRGLKAIVSSLSANGDGTSTSLPKSASAEELQKLQDELEESQREKETLESEIESLRRAAGGATATPNGSINHVRNESERTATAPSRPTTSSGRARGDTIKPAAHPSSPAKPIISPSMPNNDTTTNTYCEMCESAEHDTLDCTKFTSAGRHAQQDANRPTTAVAYSPGKENTVNGKVGSDESTTVGEQDKWCALCEKDGHLAFDCPEEQY